MKTVYVGLDLSVSASRKEGFSVHFYGEGIRKFIVTLIFVNQKH